VEEFKGRVDQLVDVLKATPPMEGFQEVLVPGEPEERTAKDQGREGIAIPEPVVQDLVGLAEELSIEVPESFGGRR